MKTAASSLCPGADTIRRKLYLYTYCNNAQLFG